MINQTVEATEANKAVILASWLQRYGEVFPSCTLQDIFDITEDCLYGIAETVTMPTMSFSTAKWIAKESKIKHLNQLAMAKTILQAHMSKAVQQSVATNGSRRCSRCGKHLPLDSFSKTSRYCKRCRSWLDFLRR